MALRASSRVQDTAADGLFHGPQSCGVCGVPLEGAPWGLVLPEITLGWCHSICLGYPA